jgi:hypothetical protein
VDPERVYSAVLAEVTDGRPVPEGRQVIEAFAIERPVGPVEGDPAGQSLSHIFSLLSLVLPPEPLQIAFRSLQSNDRQLRGTALEYLAGVLPPRIRVGLWPFLRRRPAERPVRSRVVNLQRPSVSARLGDMAMREGTRRVAGFGAR